MEGERIPRPLEHHDERIEKPGVHEMAEDVAVAVVVASDRHLRVGVGAGTVVSAVNHDRGVHKHALSRAVEAGFLQDAGGADAAGAKDNNLGAHFHGFKSTPHSLDAERIGPVVHYALNARLGDQFATGANCVVDVLVGRPLGAATASQHAHGTALESGLASRRVHELWIRLPVEADAVGRS